jgi:hypothetical protein
MRIQFQLNAKDYVEANRAHLRTSRGFLILRIFGVGLLTLTLVLFAVRPTRDTFMNVAPAVVFSGLLISVSFWVPLQARRQFTKNPQLGRTSEWNIEEDRIRITTAVSDATVNWELFHRATETKNSFVLYQQSNLINIVPKRAFNTDELDQFRELLNRRVPQNR